MSLFPRLRLAAQIALALLLIASGCRSARENAAAPPAASLTFVHVNDVYEIGALEGGRIGGMARLKTLIAQTQASAPGPVLPVLAGDFLSPSVIGTVKLGEARVRGAQMVDLMNQAGIRYVCFGNHEFDIPYEDLQKRLNESRFDWIAGNVRHQAPGGLQSFAKKLPLGDQPLPPWVIVEAPSASGRAFRVGILAVCLDANRQDFVHYDEVLASAERHYRELEPQTDAIVALTHLNAEQDRELARRLPGLLLIMGGHDHDQMSEQVGDVFLAKANANAKSAWIHELRFTRKGNCRLRSQALALDSAIVPDPEAAAAVRAWEEKAYAAFRQQGLNPEAPVCLLPQPLDGLEAHIRNQPTNLGAALTQAMRLAWPEAQAALVNGGSVRLDDYLQGSITELDLIRALPFGGRVLRVEMKGSLLAQLLDAGLANRGSGGYLQTWNVEKSGAGWSLGGAPIRPEEAYTVAVSDFLLTGKERNMDFLTPAHPGILRVQEPGSDNLGRDIRLALAAYLKKG
jgi:2',3'-cyclic-nucleotide 2'-phosphodiesterase (5'-nucleotidase family)